MGKRHTGRLLAMQTLYQLDYGQSDVDHALSNAVMGKPSTLEAKQFAEALVQATVAHHEQVDQQISHCLDHYQLSRLGGVDRSILRLAVTELCHFPKTDPSVIINEALELSKEYSSEDAARYVHGVLDQVVKEIRPCSPVSSKQQEP